MSVAALPASQPWTRREKIALGLEIAAAYLRIRGLLWRTDLPRTLAALRRAQRTGSADDVAEGARLGRAVQRTLRLVPFDSRCLLRSLVLVSLLARRGIPSSLVIGVAVEPRFAAHAWVEAEEVPLLPTNGGSYERLTRL